jgi:hypothetical protein
MLTFDLFADLQKGSGSNMGLPKRIGQIAFSSSSVAAVHWAAVIVPAGACTAKWALWHWRGSPVVDPGSVQVPDTHCADAGAVVAQPVAQVVVVVPGSQVPDAPSPWVEPPLDELAPSLAFVEASRGMPPSPWAALDPSAEAPVPEPDEPEAPPAPPPSSAAIEGFAFWDEDEPQPATL